MAEATTKMSRADVHEGDRVTMVVSPHSLDRCPSRITGEVIDAPREDDEWVRSRLREGKRLMVDFAVQTDGGDIYRYQADNGYVQGYHSDLGRRTDVARFRHFEPADE